MRHYFKRAFTGLICGVAFASMAIAETPADIDNCVQKLIADTSYTFYKLGQITSINALIAICPTDLGKQVKEIDEKLTGFVDLDSKITLNASKEIASELDVINKVFLSWVTTLEKKSINGLSQYDARYFEKLSIALPQMTINNINMGDYSLYTNTSGLDFDFFSNTFQLATTKYADRPKTWPECEKDNKCKIYVETYLFQVLWDSYWTVNAKRGIRVLYNETKAAQKKYDHFLLTSGDGLYPWEILINSTMFSKEDITYVPPVKWNVLHPTPIVYYGDKSGELKPSVLVEVIGGTLLNYSSDTNGSLPIGASFAVDLQSNRVRYGSVVHLPIKNALKHAKLDMLADFVPCDVCSIAFMTDGHNDWSIGFKINAAGLLYAPDKARTALMSYIGK